METMTFDGKVYEIIHLDAETRRVYKAMGIGICNLCDLDSHKHCYRIQCVGPDFNHIYRRLPDGDRQNS